MTDDQIKHMVNRFLGWRLPEDFQPDGGVVFTPEHSVEYMASQGKPPMRHQPNGTNLFDCRQAEAMVRYMLEGMPPSPSENKPLGSAREPSEDGIVRDEPSNPPPPEPDLDRLNSWFAQIPPGPYDALHHTNGWEVRQLDTDPTNKHHWPFRLCESIAGQRAGCDEAVFNFIAGVINAWPALLASPSRGEEPNQQDSVSQDPHNRPSSAQEPTRDAEPTG